MPGTLKTLPEIKPINWTKEIRTLNQFTTEILETMRDEIAAIWYPATVYNLRMLQAARWRLWRNGCSLSCRTDPETNRFIIRANLSTGMFRSAWAREAARRMAKPGVVVAMQTARKSRPRVKRRAA